MDYSFLFFLMTLLLLTSCDCRSLKRKRQGSATKYPFVNFVLNGHQFQIGLVTDTGDSITTTETINQVALLNVPSQTEMIPEEEKPKFSGNVEKTMYALNKMKDLYKEFGNLLKAQQEELLSLMKTQEEPHEMTKPREENVVHVNIGSDGIIPAIVNLPENQAYSGRIHSGGRKNGKSDDLSVHVQANPPLRMRTIVGYPKKSVKNTYPLQSLANIRILPREMPYQTPVPDLQYESNAQGIVQGLPSDEETFLRRGSELLLSMWKRFKAQKIQSKSEEQEQSFSDEFESMNYNS